MRVVARCSSLLLLSVVLGCADEQLDIDSSLPSVPLPTYARAEERSSSNPQHYERFFLPGDRHALDEVRTFYGDWARTNGWRQIPASEESWSNDQWQEFEMGPEVGGVRQRLVHWVDATGFWSLRLALRYYKKSGKQGAWVIVEKFFNLDEHQ